MRARRLAKVLLCRELIGTDFHRALQRILLIERAEYLYSWERLELSGTSPDVAEVELGDSIPEYVAVMDCEGKIFLHRQLIFAPGVERKLRVKGWCYSDIGEVA